MRRNLAIITTIVVILLLLVLLNAASYIPTSKPEDSEYKPNRSSFNARATGTLALYELLQDKGYKVVRWRDKLNALNSKRIDKPTTFILIGKPLIEPSREDMRDLLSWVFGGGTLVIIDRHPPLDLLPSPEHWKLSYDVKVEPSFNSQTTTENLTTGVTPIVPVQPTLLTVNVESILPSIYGARLQLIENKVPTKDDSDTLGDPKPIPPKLPQPPISPTDELFDTDMASSPVVHFSDEHGSILIDYGYGDGRIRLLSDPFIVANNGIDQADNVNLALNLVGDRNGLIAFDEFHQGLGATQNQVVAYFAGTPLLAMTGQLILIIIAMVWSKGQRFARPIPASRVDRRSKLEFITSMAEVQFRARAYDLAIENIYSRTRRALARFGGVNYHDPRSRIAEAVAARSGMNQNQVSKLMNECEEVLNGDQTSPQKALDLVRRLRKLENNLKLRLRSREIKQITNTKHLDN